MIVGAAKPGKTMKLQSAILTAFALTACLISFACGDDKDEANIDLATSSQQIYLEFCTKAMDCGIEEEEGLDACIEKITDATPPENTELNDEQYVRHLQYLDCIKTLQCADTLEELTQIFNTSCNEQTEQQTEAD